MIGRDHVAAVVDFYDAHPISEHQILEKLERDGVAMLDGLRPDLKDIYLASLRKVGLPE